MPLTKEEMMDHMVSCQFCRNIREHTNDLVVEHTKLDQKANDCEKCHINNCSSCSRKILGLDIVVSWHMRIINIKKKVRKLFGLK